MAAPRRYSQEQREALYDLYTQQGKQPAEIARMCANGEAGVPAFEIPRRSVHAIVTRMARQRSRPVKPNPERAPETRLRSLIDREIERQEALATRDGADPRTLIDLAKALRILNSKSPRQGTVNGASERVREPGGDLSSRLRAALAKGEAAATPEGSGRSS